MVNRLKTIGTGMEGPDVVPATSSQCPWQHHASPGFRQLCPISATPIHHVFITHSLQLKCPVPFPNLLVMWTEIVWLWQTHATHYHVPQALYLTCVEFVSKKMNTILTSNNLQPFRSHTTWIMRKLQTWPRPCSWIALWKICSLSPVSISCSITWEFQCPESIIIHVKRCDGAINSAHQLQIDPKYNKPMLLWNLKSSS
jgi:hypothetical protein